MALYIGLMSGTSMDGIDAALVDVETNQCLYGMTNPYSVEAKQFLEEVLTAQSVALGTLSQLNTILGRAFAKTTLDLLARAKCSSKDVVAIGSHGQTICHDTSSAIPYTVQLGCAHTIAEMTGIQVVADFRTRDMVVGGQGAPFAPIYHQALFGAQDLPLAIVNIGGISNVTFLNPMQPPTGYDIGPGNCLMDIWIKKHQSKAYDKNGEWASRGRVIEDVLTQLLSDAYFHQKPPKSLGKEYFSNEWLSSHLKATYNPEDIQATLLELTAITIARAVLESSTKPSQVILCGGGVHNKPLHQAIKNHIKDINVVSSASLGVDPDFIEAMMFAWLAEKAIHRKPLDLSTLTGAKKPVVLGAIYRI